MISSFRSATGYHVPDDDDDEDDYKEEDVVLTWLLF